MATIYDVAKRAGVSTYTVSSVLNRSAYVSPELTQRVEKAVRELNYTINDLARSLQTRKTRTVGMLIPDIASPFYAKVVRGAEDVLKKSGYSLILGGTYNKPEEQARYLGVFRSKQVDGLLLFVAPGNDEDLRAMVKARKAVVFVGRTPPGYDADSVSAENVKGTQCAIAHLASKGHQHIAIIAGERGVSTSADRIAGWRKALRQAGLAAPRELQGYGDWTAESAHEVALKFLALPERPTAIFAANFLMMTGVLRALRERGLRCPEDVEVMSSDDSEWLDVFEPRIPTVVQPAYEMGARAAELALARMASPRKKFERVLLEPQLRIR